MVAHQNTNMPSAEREIGERELEQEHQLQQQQFNQTTPIPELSAAPTENSKPPVARIVEKDMLFLANLFLCSTKPIDVSNVDFQQMAERMNLKDARSARVRYNQIKNKLFANLNPGAQTTPLKRGRPTKVQKDGATPTASPKKKPKSDTKAELKPPSTPAVESAGFSTNFSNYVGSP